MAWSLRIAGSDKTSLVDAGRSTSISMPLDGRSQMRFSIIYTGQSPYNYTPEKHDDVVVKAQDGTTRLFAGIILQRRIVEWPGSSGWWIECTCVDYSVYADWCYQTVEYTSGPTLEAVLDDLVADKLGAYGITDRSPFGPTSYQFIAVHASQVTGPTLEPFAWTNKKVSECLRELTDKTGYVWRIDADLKLRMFEAGTDDAPTNELDSSVCQSFAWYDSAQAAVNTLTVVAGSSDTVACEETFTANGGTTTSWSLSGLNIPASSEWPSVTVDGVGYPIWPVGDAPGGDGIEWDFESAGGTLSFVGDGQDLIQGTEAIVLTYQGQLPFSVTETTGGSPPIEAAYSYPDVHNYDAAVEIAEGLLDRGNQDPRTVQAVISPTSGYVGWLPGQKTQTTLRGFSVIAKDVYITHVDIELISHGFWRYAITAQEAGVIQGAPLAQWRALIKRETA